MQRSSRGQESRLAGSRLAGSRLAGWIKSLFRPRTENEKWSLQAQPDLEGDRKDEENVSLRIRKASADDADALAVIRVMSWQDAFQDIVPQHYLDQMDMEKDAQALRKNMFIGGPDFFIGFDDAIPAGFVIAEPCKDGDADESTGEISGIYVRSEYISRGYGIRLMNTAVDTLIRKGYQKIVVWTFRENARAISFFKKYGFQPDGAEQAAVIGGAVIHVFRMVLREGEQR